MQQPDRRSLSEGGSASPSTIDSLSSGRISPGPSHHACGQRPAGPLWIAELASFVFLASESAVQLRLAGTGIGYLSLPETMEVPNGSSNYSSLDVACSNSLSDLPGSDLARSGSDPGLERCKLASRFDHCCCPTAGYRPAWWNSLADSFCFPDLLHPERRPVATTTRTCSGARSYADCR